MRKLLFILPIAIMFLGSCSLSDTSTSPTATNVPTGTFTGTFRKIHLSNATGRLDTLSASFRLIMSTDSGFKVTADTTKIHAGSKGAFQVTTGYIYFIDSTYPKTGIPAKTHLVGTYAYAYDGSAFKMVNPTLIGDTIFYQYDLKK